VTGPKHRVVHEGREVDEGERGRLSIDLCEKRQSITASSLDVHGTMDTLAGGGTDFSKPFSSFCFIGESGLIIASRSVALFGNCKLT
jgi:hypothetical protein